MFDLQFILLCSIISEIITFAGVLYVWVWWLPRRPYALILRKEQDVYAIASKNYLKGSSKTTSYGDHTYNVDWERCAYLSGHQKPVMLYVEGHTEPVQLSDVQFTEKTDTKKLNLLVKHEVIKQLVEASKPVIPFTTNIIMFVLIGAVCLMIGIFIAPMVSPQQEKTATAIYEGVKIWLKMF
jgi:hypothetical protein